MTTISEEFSVETIARLMADHIGHGMTEKCMKSAESVFYLMGEVEKRTAAKCVNIIMSSVGPIDSVGEIHEQFKL